MMQTRDLVMPKATSLCWNKILLTIQRHAFYTWYELIYMYFLSTSDKLMPILIGRMLYCFQRSAHMLWLGNSHKFLTIKLL